MGNGEHIRNLNYYYSKSRFGYDIFLNGSKHFGYYPANRKVSEKEAQVLMHDLIAEKLQLRESMKVLDAGCGRGVVSNYLASKYGCFVEGITMVEFEIGDAQNHAKKMNVAGMVNYSLMDYSKMSFRDNHFDRIYTIETLCHSPDLPKTIQEFYRVLKKGGKIALFEYNLADESEFSPDEKSVVERIAAQTASPSLTVLRNGSLQKFVEEAGFHGVETADISENFKPSLRRLRRFAQIPDFFAGILKTREDHPNLTIAMEFCRLAEKGLYQYKIITAEK